MKKWIRRFVLLFLGLVLGTGIYMICAERILKDPFPMPFGIGFANVVSGSMEPVLKKGTLLLVRKKGRCRNWRHCSIPIRGKPDRTQDHFHRRGSGYYKGGCQ